MFGNSAKVGKLIVTGIACCVDPTGVAITVTGLDAAIQAEEWLKKHPDLAKLAAEIDAKFQAEIKKPRYDKPTDIRLLLPQMLEASFPDAEVIAAQNLEADLILAEMKRHLTDTEHRKPENWTAFEAAFLPLLTTACNDKRLTDALQPAIIRKQGRDMKKLMAMVDAGQIGSIPLGDMIALAGKFGEHNITDPTSLTNFLTLKADEYRALKTEVDAINDGMKRLANLKAAAQDAIARVDLEEVENLLSIVHATELDEAAKTAELRANNALLRGKTDVAYALLTSAAQSLAATDHMEPTRRLLSYGEILFYHGLRYGSDGLRLAETMFRKALTEAERDSNRDWVAHAHNSLAITLRNQGSRTDGPAGAQLLADAVTAYRAALEVRTRADHPVNWATTQNNLATALSEQGTRTDGPAGAKLLADAVTAYRAALEVYTRADHPVDWAMTQNNLANALSDQGSRTDGPAGAKLLAGAVTAYRAALEVRTRADHPVDWAMTMENIAIAQREIASHSSCDDPRPALLAALAAVDEALTVYDPEHMSYDHGTATRLRDAIQSRLDALD